MAPRSYTEVLAYWRNLTRVSGKSEWTSQAHHWDFQAQVYINIWTSLLNIRYDQAEQKPYNSTFHRWGYSIWELSKRDFSILSFLTEHLQKEFHQPVWLEQQQTPQDGGVTCIHHSFPMTAPQSPWFWAAAVNTSSIFAINSHRPIFSGCVETHCEFSSSLL